MYEVSASEWVSVCLPWRWVIEQMIKRSNERNIAKWNIRETEQKQSNHENEEKQNYYRSQKWTKQMHTEHFNMFKHANERPQQIAKIILHKLHKQPTICHTWDPTLALNTLCAILLYAVQLCASLSVLRAPMGYVHLNVDGILPNVANAHTLTDLNVQMSIDVRAKTILYIFLYVSPINLIYFHFNV